MKTRNWLVRFVIAGAIVTALAFPAAAQDKVQYRLYTVPTPNAQPEILTAVDDAAVFFTENTGNKIGKLNPRHNTITEWTLPDARFPHDIRHTDEDVLFIAEQGALNPHGTGTSGALAGFFPESGFLKEWTIANSFPEHIAVVGNFIYYNDPNNNLIGRLNMRTGHVRQWAFPVPIPNSNGICADEDGENIYTGGNQLVVSLNAESNLMKVYALPNLFAMQHPVCLESRHVVFSDATGFFGTVGSPLFGDSVYLFDPGTNKFTQWQSPIRPLAIRAVLPVETRETDNEGNEALQISFTGFFLPVVGTFNTAKSTPLSSGVVAPFFSSVVTPSSTTATITTHVLPKSKTIVSPTVTTLTGTTTNGIEEWTVPVPPGCNAPVFNGVSLTGECVGLDWLDFLNDSIVFTQPLSNQIGIFVPHGGKDTFGN